MLVFWIATAWAGSRLEPGVPGHVLHPVWSPDGRHVVVEVQEGPDRATLHVLGVDGGAVPITLPGSTHPFGGPPPVAMNPHWHGSAIVFEATDASGHFRLYTATLDGIAVQVPIPRPGHVVFPTADDRGELSFLAGNDLVVRAVDGSLRQVTRSAAPEMFPLLAPDGGSICFSRLVGATQDLFLLDLDTGTERPLAGGAGDQTRPARVEGGVAFFDGSRGTGLWDLVRVEPGGHRRWLARDVKLPVRARPAASPKGECLAYVSAEGIGVVRADGTSRTRIATEQVAVAEVALGVRGSRIWAAWTGLPATGAGWRGLWVEDVTDRVTAVCNSSR